MSMLLEKSIIPKVDTLQGSEIMVICQGMRSQRIGSEIQYELLATEFGRKVDQVGFKEQSTIAEALAFGNYNTSSSYKTLETLSFAYTEALNLVQADGKLEVPGGIYSDSQASIIEKAGRQLANMKNQHQLLSLVNLVWAYSVAVSKL